MDEDNVIRFPRPNVHSAVKMDMEQLARLAEGVARQMDGGIAPLDLRELLDRIEEASAGLRKIGQITLDEADRIKTDELCLNVRVMIERIRTMSIWTGRGT